MKAIYLILLLSLFLQQAFARASAEKAVLDVSQQQDLAGEKTNAVATPNINYTGAEPVNLGDLVGPHQVGDDAWMEVELSFEFAQDEKGKEIVQYFLNDTLEFHWTLKFVDELKLKAATAMPVKLKPFFFKEGRIWKGPPATFSGEVLDKLKWSVIEYPQRIPSPSVQYDLNENNVISGIISGKLTKKKVKSLWDKSLRPKEEEVILYETPYFTYRFYAGEGKYLIYLLYSLRGGEGGPQIALLGGYDSIVSDGKWIQIFNKTRDKKILE